MHSSIHNLIHNNPQHEAAQPAHFLERVGLITIFYFISCV
jgi:hypothetical protein